MSAKQDAKFMNHFSLVLGILITIAILLFVFARMVGAATQAQHVKAEQMEMHAVEARTRPFAQVAVAGADNSALAAQEAPAAGAAAAAPAAQPKTGEEVYNAACIACHGQGIGGAPKFGDKAAWSSHVAKGLDVLHMHAIEGFTGPNGVMPPKGGRADLPDDVIKMGVDYMVEHSR
ncbi:MAG TPA: c-type cytochrome [Steroidobacteraceae bacterium]